MAAPVRKLCLLGDLGVGKTTLAARLAGTAADATPGITVHRWTPANAPACAVWDIDGRTLLDCLNQTFLSGADGFVLVADAGRPDTARDALELLRHARALSAPRPAVLLLNKSDAAPGAAFDDPPAGVPVFRTSASTGTGVVDAFLALAARIPLD